MDNSHLKNFFPKWKYSFLFNLTVYLFYGKIYVILSNTKEKDMALVEFKNVEKYYGDYHALRNINLSFEKGQVVVLLGPSGSGKSTLIRTINALEDTTREA